MAVVCFLASLVLLNLLLQGIISEGVVILISGVEVSGLHTHSATAGKNKTVKIL